MVISLVIQNVIFNYATKFAAENPTIPTPGVFDITDEIYSDFVKFALQDSFRYETESYQVFKELEETVQREKFYSEAKDELQKLKEKLLMNKEEDLNLYKAEISDFLRSEIIGRYYYEEGQIETNLRDDLQLIKAIEILKDQDKYKSILSSDFINKQQIGMKTSMLYPSKVKQNKDGDDYYFISAMK